LRSVGSSNGASSSKAIGIRLASFAGGEPCEPLRPSTPSAIPTADM
jgi:hypothetical protein